MPKPVAQAQKTPNPKEFPAPARFNSEGIRGKSRKNGLHHGAPIHLVDQRVRRWSAGRRHEIPCPLRRGCRFAEHSPAAEATEIRSRTQPGGDRVSCRDQGTLVYRDEKST